jgi:hypothetical protein
MATNLAVGEHVYVPRTRMGLDSNAPSAFVSTTVRAVEGRSVRVDLPNGQGWSAPIATSAVHRNIGVLIFRIGDFATELSLLDPLAKSVLQYFRLLLPDDMVGFCEIRSPQEFQKFWTAHHGGYSHVILIGHGRRDGLKFAVGDWIDAEMFGDALTAPDPVPVPKTFISLCCSTGYAAFGQRFSNYDVCDSLIAPFHSIHGAIASQFCQTFFAYHLLQGETTRVAFKHARKAIPGGTIFRLWQGGEMTGDD